MTDGQTLEEVIYVSWEEMERGWGRRPDGCSLHISKEDFQLFEKEYWDRMPEEVPEIYSRPAGKPVNVHVGQELLKSIQEGKHGLRLRKNEETELVAKKDLVYGKERDGWVSEL